MLSVSFEYLSVLSNAALLGFEFLSAPLHGYLFVRNPKSVYYFVQSLPGLTLLHKALFVYVYSFIGKT